LNHAEALAARFLAAGSLVAGLAPHHARALNAADNFIGASDGSLLVTTNWSLGVLPRVTHDAVFTEKPGIRVLSANNLIVGSFNLTATTGIFSIRNYTGTVTSHNLTLGGSGNLGNAVSGTAEDLLYAATGSTFNIKGDNSNGAGVLHLVLGQNGHFNIAGSCEISSIISDSGNHYGFTKTGAGKLTLSGVNTYGGNTTVSAGTLELAASAGLKFVVTDSSNNKLDGTGTLTLNGGFTIDTTAVTLTTGSWTLVECSALKEAFGATFQVAGADHSGHPHVWTKVEGTQTWTFTEATGVLALTSSALSAYDTWATTAYGLSGAEAAFDLDHDHDGIANGVEWILGGDPTRNDAAAILPAITGSPATGLTLVFKRAAAALAAATLVVEWGSGPGALSNTIAIGTTDSGPNGNQPTVDVDAPAAGQVTVNIPAANASGGKIFARLKAVPK